MSLNGKEVGLGSPVPSGVHTPTRLPAHADDVRYELIDGELIVAPSPVPRHQKVSSGFVGLMAPFANKNRLGDVFAAPLDVYLSDTNLLQPDIRSYPTNALTSSAKPTSRAPLTLSSRSPPRQPRSATEASSRSCMLILECWNTGGRTLEPRPLRLFAWKTAG